MTLAAPNGAPVPLPEEPGLYRLYLDDVAIGAVWSERIDRTRYRTRVSLVPTATRRIGAPVAPFGYWSIASEQDDVALWILRDDTGFEADPFQPKRPSWFDDVHYIERDAAGEPARTDDPIIPGAPQSVVRREGSASVLASSRHEAITVVTALEEDLRPAFYASLFPEGREADFALRLSDQNPDLVHSDANPIGPFLGRAVLGNATPDRFRGLGTSMAAALKAGELAHSAAEDQPVA